MKRLALLLCTMVLLVPSGWAQGQAQTWSGALVDAACKQGEPNKKCSVAATTIAFGLVLADGKFLKFDEGGNATAGKEMQKVEAKGGDVMAKVSGMLEGSTIKVETLEIQ